MQELKFIMKAFQTLIGEFPSMELGGVAERPEALRKWRFATTTALEAAGPHVTTWWDSCWTLAEAAHRLYLQAPVMHRDGAECRKGANPAIRSAGGVAEAARTGRDATEHQEAGHRPGHPGHAC